VALATRAGERVTDPTIDRSLPSEVRERLERQHARERLERAYELLKQVVDATPWANTWAPTPRVLLEPSQILIGVGLRVEANRGVDPLESDLVVWSELRGPLPTSHAEAAQAVRRAVVEFFDHEMRESICLPGGVHAFEPHRTRLRDGYVAPTGDYRFSINAT
jgi:hypothetical protein